MNDTEATATHWYTALPPERKPAFLALWAHNITITARWWYAGQPEAEELIAKLVALNEVQHVLTIELHHLLTEQRVRRPDAVLVADAFERARQAGCEGHLRAAFGFSMRQFQPPHEGLSPEESHGTCWPTW